MACVAMWQYDSDSKRGRVPLERNDDIMATLAPCPLPVARVDMWNTTNVISYCVRQKDDYQKLPQRRIMPAVFPKDVSAPMYGKKNVSFAAKLIHNS